MGWTLTKRAVNSKPLFEEIHDFIVTGMDDTGVNWASEVQRTAYIEMLDEFLAEVAEEGKIEQWDVRCNSRNNKLSDMNNGKFVVDVFYKQRNCLNTTQLRYEIIDKQEVVDFDLSF
jgi:hypothetical protein